MACVKFQRTPTHQTRGVNFGDVAMCLGCRKGRNRVCAHSSPRQHGKQNRVAPPEVMIERGSCVEAREPHQRIAEPTVDVAQRKAELRRLRKPGLNVTHGKQRERVAFEPRADNGCDRHQDEQRIKSLLPELGADLHPGWHSGLLARERLSANTGAQVSAQTRSCQATRATRG